MTVEDVNCYKTIHNFSPHTASVYADDQESVQHTDLHYNNNENFYNSALLNFLSLKEVALSANRIIDRKVTFHSVYPSVFRKLFYIRCLM